MHARVMRVRVNHGEVMMSMASSVVMIYDCQYWSLDLGAGSQMEMKIIRFNFIQ